MEVEANHMLLAGLHEKCIEKFEGHLCMPDTIDVSTLIIMNDS